MLNQILGVTPPNTLHQTDLPPPISISEAAGGNAGLAWLVEMEPISRTIFIQDYRVAGLSGLDPLGLVGIAQIGNVSRHMAITAAPRRYVTLARGMTTTSSDSPADTFIPGLLDRPRIDVRRELPTGNDRLSGFVAATSASVVLANTDGELDGFVSHELMRDRPVRLKVAATTRSRQGLETAPALSQFATVFAGRANDVQVGDDDSVQIRVADDVTRLDRFIQSRLYGGTGGVMGGPELEGQPIPLAYGSVKGITPTLVDALRGIYQVHDGEVLDIHVRDRGQSLGGGPDARTFEALSALSTEGEAIPPDIPAGSYATCRRQGYFRLGGVSSGTITCDVEGEGLNDGDVGYAGGVFYAGGIGYSSPGTATHRRFAGGMIFRILTTRGFFLESEIDVARSDQFDLENPWPLGLPVPSTQRPTIREICTRIADSVGAVILRNQQGQLFLRALDGPGTSSPIVIAGNLGDRGIQRLALPWGAPWWSVRVSYGRQWTPLAFSDIAADLDAVTAAQVQRSVQVVEINDADLQALIPDRPPLEIDTLLLNKADALKMGTRLQAFYAKFWAAWQVPAYGLGFRIDPLDTVTVQHPRYGLDAGQPMLCVAITERPGDYETELVMLG